MDYSSVNIIEPEEKDNKALQLVKFFVNANSFETHQLWREFSNSNAAWAAQSDNNDNSKYERLEWEQIQSGFWFTICNLSVVELNKTFPINISFTFAYLNKQLVCFWESPSMLTHFDICENYLQQRYPIKHNDRLAYVNAQNFHNAYHFLIKNKNNRFKFIEEKRVEDYLL